jgi:hypothetical protein
MRHRIISTTLSTLRPAAGFMMITVRWRNKIFSHNHYFSQTAPIGSNGLVFERSDTFCRCCFPSDVPTAAKCGEAHIKGDIFKCFGSCLKEGQGRNEHHSLNGIFTRNIPTQILYTFLVCGHVTCTTRVLWIGKTRTVWQKNSGTRTKNSMAHAQWASCL